MSPVACPFCHQPIPDSRPLEPSREALDTVARNSVAHLGPCTTRQVAAYLFAPRPSDADLERARRLLERAVRAGQLERVDRWDDSLREVVLYRLPTLAPTAAGG